MINNFCDYISKVTAIHISGE